MEKYIREQSLSSDSDDCIKIDAWDWRYYAEKVRQKEYEIDEAEVKPYFSLKNMTQAIFDTAKKLFGLKFVLRPDIESYHPDVDTYEVYDTNGDSEKLIAIFLHDNFARPNKRSGAWMSNYREQKKGVIPIVVNNNNFNKGSDTEPTLLSFDDAVTLFHEFGHGLHGMLSEATYSTLAGTSVLRDFVELPSQLYEHWLSERSVLMVHARHYSTNKHMPEELLNKLMAARKFGQGFATVEYTICTLLDTKLHSKKLKYDGAKGLDEREDIDISGFEKSELGEYYK